MCSRRLDHKKLKIDWLKKWPHVIYKILKFFRDTHSHLTDKVNRPKFPESYDNAKASKYLEDPSLIYRTEDAINVVENYAKAYGEFLNGNISI